MKNLDLPNWGVIKTSLPKELNEKLLKEALDLKTKRDWFSGLSDKYPNVVQHYHFDKYLKELEEFIGKAVDFYQKQYPGYLKNIKLLDKPLPLMFARPWINYQKENQYIPIHTHDGVLSYSIWLKIPVESIFEFSYNSIVGDSIRHRLILDYKDEGSLILFPSQLNHMVYPFVKSKEIRIGISGNILLHAS